MSNCLEIFVDKIISNLMSNADSPKLDEQRVVDLALDVFTHFLSN